MISEPFNRGSGPSGQRSTQKSVRRRWENVANSAAQGLRHESQNAHPHHISPIGRIHHQK